MNKNSFHVTRNKLHHTMRTGIWHFILVWTEIAISLFSIVSGCSEQRSSEAHLESGSVSIYSSPENDLLDRHYLDWEQRPLGIIETEPMAGGGPH